MRGGSDTLPTGGNFSRRNRLERPTIVPQDDTFSIVRSGEKCQFSSRLAAGVGGRGGYVGGHSGSAGASPSQQIVSARTNPTAPDGNRTPGRRSRWSRSEHSRSKHHAQGPPRPRAAWSVWRSCTSDTAAARSPAPTTRPATGILDTRIRKVAWSSSSFGTTSERARIASSMSHQRSVGRRRISLSRTAWRTPSGLVSMAAIWAAGVVALSSCCLPPVPTAARSAKLPSVWSNF